MYRLCEAELKSNSVYGEISFIGVKQSPIFEDINITTYNNVHSSLLSLPITDKKISDYNNMLSSFVAEIVHLLQQSNESKIDAKQKEVIAKNSLFSAREKIINMDIGDIRVVSPISHTNYLRKMPPIYWHLQHQQYCQACSEVIKFIQNNCLGYERVRNALIVAFRELDRRENMSWRISPESRCAEYPRTMLELTDYFHKNKPTKEERIAYIDFLINAVKADLIGSAISNVAYAEEFTNEDDGNAFPINAYIKRTEVRMMALDNSNTITLPHDKDKMFAAVQDINKSGYIAKENDIVANYFPEIDLAITYEKRHHIAAAIANKKTIMVNVQVYNLSNAFDSITTNGIFWYVNGKNIGSVLDIRLAMLYTFALWKHQTELGINIEDEYRANS